MAGMVAALHLEGKYEDPQPRTLDQLWKVDGEKMIRRDLYTTESYRRTSEASESDACAGCTRVRKTPGLSPIRAVVFSDSLPIFEPKNNG